MDDRNRKGPKDIHAGQIERISRDEYEALPDRAIAELERRMREHIAHFIQGVKVGLTVEKHFVERRIDLYVATPDEFWGIVHREAEQIALRYGRSLPLADGIEK